MDLDQAPIENQNFKHFSSKKEKSLIIRQHERAIRLIQEAFEKNTLEAMYQKVIRFVLDDLLNSKNEKAKNFQITVYEAEEMALLEDHQIIQYLFHRYRYVVYPLTKDLDDYPPCLQIEPASVCNFRCVFCYQTDRSFSQKSGGFMGTMTLDQFKQIIDQIEGYIDFVTLASRGEPLIACDFIDMIDYTQGKFLNLKVNTNASMLTEKYAHAILSSGVKTLVFSADAAEEPLYSQLRVNGNLQKTLKNIETFQTIREKQYPDAKIITRVSGVMYKPEEQNIASLKRLWNSLVDQVSFVNYTPWEKIYQAPPNLITSPCTELWRRMFVWQDGGVNPCDSDYKSNLKIGSVKENTISELWTSSQYQHLRTKHLQANRRTLDPCKRCVVT